MTLGDVSKKLSDRINSTDKRAISKYCRSSFTMILNEYLKMFKEEELVKEFVETFGQSISAGQLPEVGIITAYKGLLFEQERQINSKAYQRLYPTPLHAVKERINAFMKRMIYEKKPKANL